MTLAKKRVRLASEASTPRARDATVVKLEPVASVGIEGLRLARVVGIGPEGVQIECRGRTLSAIVDASVHDAVIEGALAREEHVLVEIEGGVARIVGALRTQPVPGLDRIEHLDLKADTIRLDARSVAIEGDEVVVSSKTAKIVLRAAGEIESFAERIVSRASGVHKIVGRMLRLN